MIALTGHMQSLITGRLYRWAHCWKIERRDGVTIRGTDHDTDLVLEDGETYLASVALSVSAEERNTNLDMREREINSLVTDDQITYADLATGRYDQSRVTQYLVDFRVPWAGAFTSSVFDIVGLEYTDGVWTASVESIARKLGHPTGRYYTSNEPVAYPDADFEDARGDLAAWTTAGEITAVSGTHDFGAGAETVDGRQTIETDLVAAAGYYTWARYTPVTGANVGQEFDVAIHTAAGGLKFLIEAPAAFVVGDTFSIVAGYSGTFPEARDKFSAGDAFRGFPHIPSGDRLSLLPDARYT